MTPLLMMNWTNPSPGKEFKGLRRCYKNGPIQKNGKRFNFQMNAIFHEVLKAKYIMYEKREQDMMLGISALLTSTHK